MLKMDISKLSESQLGELERGYDAYIKGSNLRVLDNNCQFRKQGKY